jgi:hypothetical protein
MKASQQEFTLHKKKQQFKRHVFVYVFTSTIFVLRLRDVVVIPDDDWEHYV